MKDFAPPESVLFALHRAPKSDDTRWWPREKEKEKEKEEKKKRKKKKKNKNKNKKRLELVTRCSGARALSSPFGSSLVRSHGVSEEADMRSAAHLVAGRCAPLKCLAS